MKDAKKLLTEFLRASEEQVLAAFAKIPNSWRAKKGEWVYLPGKRDDRVLLVAHADTVRWGHKGPVDLMWLGDVVTLANDKDNALGGDDRAGCAMMFDLWDGTHSVLITTGEERGCTGSRQALRDIPEELGKHQFAVQVDRRGNRQAVFYDVATREFKDFMVSSLSQFDYQKVAWREYQGSCTDIKVLCPEIGICGVNLSAGFYHEHSDSEMVVLASWLHTRTALRRILKQDKLERFVLPKKGWSQKAATSGAAITSTIPSSQTTEQEIAIPEGVLSRKQQKKLTKKIRASYMNGRIKRLTAWGLLQKVYKHLSYTAQVQIISEVLPFGNAIYPSESHPVVLCIECGRSVDHHLLSCSKRSDVKKLAETTSTAIVREDRCKSCGAIIRIGHFKHCPLNKGKDAELVKDAKQCPECSALVGHYQSCPLEVPVPVKKIERCEECKVDLLLGHLATCSSFKTQLNSHVREYSQQPPKKHMEIVTCFHDCLICRIEDKRNGTWSHIKPQSGKCVLYIQAPCPGHSRETIKLVGIYEDAVQEARRQNAPATPA